ncbi:MAG TPA: Mut7-C RNAse domain-containing protein [Bacteroidales bacterium]|nr:Mut7-C RNAse domain-containing protein [Bacteroidales bacterium]
MNRALFRFYEELNDFLPVARKKQQFIYKFDGNPSVKDIIESLGVPHPEIDLILINGESVDFSAKVKDGDSISVYPVFESLDISGIQHLRKEPLRNTCFILDVHLGKLAKNLRMLGFDSLYEKYLDDNEIIYIANNENRIILTRDRMLLKNGFVTHGYWIRSSDPGLQTAEVIKKFSLSDNMKPLTRCLECNTTVISVSKDEIIEKLPPRTRQYYNDFRRCPGCGRVYWKGSHYERMMSFVGSLRDSSAQTLSGTEAGS